MTIISTNRPSKTAVPAGSTVKADQRLPVSIRTLRQARILKAITGKSLVQLANELFEQRWQQALEAGQVTEAMLAGPVKEGE